MKIPPGLVGRIRNKLAENEKEWQLKQKEKLKSKKEESHKKSKKRRAEDSPDSLRIRIESEKGEETDNDEDANLVLEGQNLLVRLDDLKNCKQQGSAQSRHVGYNPDDF